MAARHWLTLTLALCGAVAVTGAEAAAKKKAKAVAAGPAPIARGCTYVQAPYCLGVSTAKGRYSLWGANPFIPPGTAVEPDLVLALSNAHPDFAPSIGSVPAAKLTI